MPEEAKRALRVYMWHLSEEVWAAGWLDELENELWCWVESRRAGLDTPEVYHPCVVGQGWQYDADTLAWLAEQAGGWWFWSSENGRSEFVEMDEWRKRYVAWKNTGRR